MDRILQMTANRVSGRLRDGAGELDFTPPPARRVWISRKKEAAVNRMM